MLYAIYALFGLAVAGAVSTHKQCKEVDAMLLKSRAEMEAAQADMEARTAETYRQYNEAIASLADLR